jgi:hypothetical protein
MLADDPEKFIRDLTTLMVAELEIVKDHLAALADRDRTSKMGRGGAKGGKAIALGRASADIARVAARLVKRL